MLLLSGCAKQPPVYGSLGVDASLGKGETLTVVLTEYKDCNEGIECVTSGTTASKERSLAGCLTDELPGGAVLRAARVRDSAFPGKDFEASPRSLPEWQEMLQSPDFRRAIEPLNLRYVLFATLTSQSHPLPGEFDTRILASAAHSKWRSTAHLQTEVLDVKANNRAGTLSATKSGDGGVVIGFFLIVPVIVIPHWTRTEAHTCSAVARALADSVRPAKGASF